MRLESVSCTIVALFAMTANTGVFEDRMDIFQMPPFRFATGGNLPGREAAAMINSCNVSAVSNK